MIMRLLRQLLVPQTEEPATTIGALSPKHPRRVNLAASVQAQLDLMDEVELIGYLTWLHNQGWVIEIREQGTTE